jgi:hypothetical protein
VSAIECLHILTTSYSRCDRCGHVVKKAARLAARLRGRFGVGESAATQVPQGVSRHTVVKGDAVGEVVLWVRPRQAKDLLIGTGPESLPADPPHLKSDLVAEVTDGVNLAALGLYVGLVVDVKMDGVVTLSSRVKS